ncbi:MAG: ATP-dependent Clp protease adapter ClpS [Acinetobacter sp.]
MKSTSTRNLKRKMTLNDAKVSFQQSGLTDWHITPLFQSGHTEDDPDSDLAVKVAPPEFKRPPLYAVVLMNDDYTPMEFVIEILQEFFAMSLDQATQVMLTVHYEGKGVAGIYPRDIAETKANQVNNYARSQGHPLLCQIEPKS